MLTGILFLFLGLPLSIASTIIFSIKRKKVLIPIICIPISIFIGLIFLFIGSYFYGQTDEYKQAIAKKEQKNLEQLYNQGNYVNILETSTNICKEELNNIVGINKISKEIIKNSVDIKKEFQNELFELSEAEYKELCEEINYNDIDENYVGKHICKEILWDNYEENGIYTCAALEDFNEEFNFYQHTYRIYKILDCRNDKDFPLESNDIVKIYGEIIDTSKHFHSGLYIPKVKVYYIEYIRKWKEEPEDKTIEDIATDRYEEYKKIEEENAYKNSLNTDYNGETKNIEGMNELPLNDYIAHCDKLNYSNLTNGEDYTGRYVSIHVQLYGHKVFSGIQGKINKVGNWYVPEDINDDVWTCKLYSELAESYILPSGHFQTLYFANIDNEKIKKLNKEENLVIYGQIIKFNPKEKPNMELIVRYYEIE